MHGLGAQPAGHGAAALVAGDQAGVRQHFEMLHHRRQRHRERRGQRADRQAIGLAQARQQSAPGRIGQRGEGAVERLYTIVNHVVKYTARATRVKLPRTKMGWNRPPPKIYLTTRL